ncbi:MAG: hypothetical protein V3T56_03175, partial [Gemmatimonadales bacterium]
SPRRRQKKTSVVPIAAVVLVIAAAGTTAAVVMGGSENGGSNAELVPNTPAATNATDGGNSESLGNQTTDPIAMAESTLTGAGIRTDPPGRGDPEIENQNLDSSGVEPSTAALDIVAVSRDLNAILDSVHVNPAVMRARAQTHYDNQRLPAETRAYAAAVVAQSYLMEARDAEGCIWYGLASALVPADTMYTSSMTILRCTQ